jgi:protein gp37
MSKINWCDETWNVTAGCSKIAPGCLNCWAEKFAHRLKGSRIKGYGNVIGKKGWNGKVNLLRHNLDKPMHWKKPRRVFVNSMSDLFHPQVPFEFISKVFRVMEKCDKHRFFILTKRIERMKQFFVETTDNVFPGVSVSTQNDVDELIPILLQIPVVHRFVSIEPSIERVNLSKYLKQLEWIICGGESGARKRYCAPEWIREISMQCKDADVPLFVKQVHIFKTNHKIELIKDIGRFHDYLQIQEFPKF